MIGHKLHISEVVFDLNFQFLFNSILCFSGSKMMYGLFFPMAKKGTVFVVDTVRSDQMPNLNALFNSERNVK